MESNPTSLVNIEALNVGCSQQPLIPIAKLLATYSTCDNHLPNISLNLSAQPSCLMHENSALEQLSIIEKSGKFVQLPTTSAK